MSNPCDGVASIHSDLCKRRLVFMKLVYHQCVGVWADQLLSENYLTGVDTHKVTKLLLQR